MAKAKDKRSSFFDIVKCFRSKHSGILVEDEDSKKDENFILKN